MRDKYAVAPWNGEALWLPVAVGCSHNRCRFCMLFKHLTYRILPLDLVKAEIDRIVNLGGNPQRIFLGDGNAFSLPASHLATILNWCCEAFPGLCSVSMDAHVRNILSKSDAELAALQKLKLTDLYLGIECGLEDVLLKHRIRAIPLLRRNWPYKGFMGPGSNTMPTL